MARLLDSGGVCLLRRLAVSATVIVLSAMTTPAAAGDLDPQLVYLFEVRTQLGQGTPGDLLKGRDFGTPGEALRPLAARGLRGTAGALSLATQTDLPGSIRFVDSPSPGVLRDFQARGVVFSDFGSGPAGSRTVYPARIPWTQVAAIAAHPAVLSLSPAWRPVAVPPLAISRPQVQADPLWHLEDPDGDPVTGTGTLIVDFDTGVNLYHPALFFADGDTVDWIDADQSGDLSDGDAVDLDADQTPDPGEALRYLEAHGVELYGNTVGVYDTDFDWLYNDANDNLERDYGPEFGEQQPGYGELLFLSLDQDADDRLDPGERLVTLKTSKIRAIRGRDQMIYERGINLLQAELDYHGHGTAVSGIACGGWAGLHRMSGVAPGAEMLHAQNDYTGEPPFLVPIEEHLAWAAAYLPDAFLIEDGEWIWEFMDGSSNVETMLNEFAADQNIIQVVPAGNLATGNMHGRWTSDQTAVLHLNGYGEVCWLDLLWLEPTACSVTLTVPGGPSAVLNLDGSTQQIGDYEVYSYFSISPRGTRRVDVRIEHENPGTLLEGDFVFGCVARGGAGSRDAFTIHGYFADIPASWFTASYWLDLDQTHTVTWPATADSAISIAAYNPDGDGGINGYSGWGPRIDERPAVDLAAPGSTVYSLRASNFGEYRPFGGTSAAGPHVAGAAALLRQLYPTLTPGTFRRLIRHGAQQDQHTTDPHRWGAGKLRIWDSLPVGAAAEPAPPAAGDRGIPGLVLAAMPNPVLNEAEIRMEIPRSGTLAVEILDLAGRLLYREHLRADAPGTHRLTWDARDARGRRLPAGVYLARLRFQGATAQNQILLLR